MDVPKNQHPDSLIRNAYASAGKRDMANLVQANQHKVLRARGSTRTIATSNRNWEPKPTMQTSLDCRTRRGLRGVECCVKPLAKSTRARCATIEVAPPTTPHQRADLDELAALVAHAQRALHTDPRRKRHQHMTARTRPSRAILVLETRMHDRPNPSST